MEEGFNNANNPFGVANGATTDNIITQKSDGLLLNLNEKFKQNGTDLSPPLEFFSNEKSNGKRSASDFEDDDFGPETDIDAVDDVLSPDPKDDIKKSFASGFAMSPNNNPLLEEGVFNPFMEHQEKAALEMEKSIRKRETREAFEDEERTAREETPTPPADGVHDVSGLVENPADSESEDEWNYIKGDEANKENISPQPEKEVADIPEEDDTMSQLNPNAAEFVPVSPTRSIPSPACRMLINDPIVSQSPKKANDVDISLPNPNEFAKEVKSRPSEIETNNDDDNENPNHSPKDLMDNILNGKNIDEIPEFQPGSTPKKVFQNEEFHFGPNAAPFTPKPLDQSEALSTKAVYGDESVATLDTSFNESVTHDLNILNKESDPMSMSFYADKEESNPFDLNKVQPLPDNLDEFLKQPDNDSFNDTISDLPEYDPLADNILNNDDAIITTDLDKQIYDDEKELASPLEPEKDLLDINKESCDENRELSSPLSFAKDSLDVQRQTDENREVFSPLNTEKDDVNKEIHDDDKELSSPIEKELETYKDFSSPLEVEKELNKEHSSPLETKQEFLDESKGTFDEIKEQFSPLKPEKELSDATKQISNEDEGICSPFESEKELLELNKQTYDDEKELASPLDPEKEFENADESDFSQVLEPVQVSKPVYEVLTEQPFCYQAPEKEQLIDVAANYEHISGDVPNASEVSDLLKTENLPPDVELLNAVDLQLNQPSKLLHSSEVDNSILPPEPKPIFDTESLVCDKPESRDLSKNDLPIEKYESSMSPEFNVIDQPHFTPSPQPDDEKFEAKSPECDRPESGSSVCDLSAPKSPMPEEPVSPAADSFTRPELVRDAQERFEQLCKPPQSPQEDVTSSVKDDLSEEHAADDSLVARSLSPDKFIEDSFVKESTVPLDTSIKEQSLESPLLADNSIQDQPVQPTSLVDDNFVRDQPFEAEPPKVASPVAATEDKIPPPRLCICPPRRKFVEEELPIDVKTENISPEYAESAIVTPSEESKAEELLADEKIKQLDSNLVHQSVSPVIQKPKSKTLQSESEKEKRIRSPRNFKDPNSPKQNQQNYEFIYDLIYLLPIFKIEETPIDHESKTNVAESKPERISIIGDIYSQPLNNDDSEASLSINDLKDIKFLAATKPSVKIPHSKTDSFSKTIKVQFISESQLFKPDEDKNVESPPRIASPEIPQQTNYDVVCDYSYILPDSKESCLDNETNITNRTPESIENFNSVDSNETKPSKDEDSSKTSCLKPVKLFNPDLIPFSFPNPKKDKIKPLVEAKIDAKLAEPQVICTRAELSSPTTISEPILDSDDSKIPRSITDEIKTENSTKLVSALNDLYKNGHMVSESAADGSQIRDSPEDNYELVCDYSYILPLPVSVKEDVQIFDSMPISFCTSFKERDQQQNCDFLYDCLHIIPVPRPVNYDEFGGIIKTNLSSSETINLIPESEKKYQYESTCDYSYIISFESLSNKTEDVTSDAVLHSEQPNYELVCDYSYILPIPDRDQNDLINSETISESILPKELSETVAEPSKQKIIDTPPIESSLDQHYKPVCDYSFSPPSPESITEEIKTASDKNHDLICDYSYILPIPDQIQNDLTVTEPSKSVLPQELSETVAKPSKQKIIDTTPPIESPDQHYQPVCDYSFISPSPESITEEIKTVSHDPQIYGINISDSLELSYTPSDYSFFRQLLDSSIKSLPKYNNKTPTKSSRYFGTSKTADQQNYELICDYPFVRPIAEPKQTNLSTPKLYEAFFEPVQKLQPVSFRIDSETIGKVSALEDVGKTDDIASNSQTNLEELKVLSLGNPRVPDLGTDGKSTSEAFSKTANVSSFKTNLDELKVTSEGNSEVLDLSIDGKSTSEVSKIEDLALNLKENSEKLSLGNPQVFDLGTDVKSTSEAFSRTANVVSSFKTSLEELKVTSEGNPAVLDLPTDGKSISEVFKTGDFTPNLKENSEELSLANPRVLPDLGTDRKSTSEAFSKTANDISSFKTNLEGLKLTSEGNPAVLDLPTGGKSTSEVSKTENFTPNLKENLEELSLVNSRVPDLGTDRKSTSEESSKTANDISSCKTNLEGMKETSEGNPAVLDLPTDGKSISEVFKTGDFTPNLKENLEELSLVNPRVPDLATDRKSTSEEFSKTANDISSCKTNLEGLKETSEGNPAVLDLSTDGKSTSKVSKTERFTPNLKENLEEPNICNPRVPDFPTDGKSTSEAFSKNVNISSFKTNLDELKVTSKGHPEVPDLSTGSESTSEVSKTGDFDLNLKENSEELSLANPRVPDLGTDRKSTSEAFSKTANVVSNQDELKVTSEGNPEVLDLSIDGKSTSEVSKTEDFALNLKENSEKLSLGNPQVFDLGTDVKSTSEAFSRTANVVSSFKTSLEELKVTSEGHPAVLDLPTDCKSTSEISKTGDFAPNLKENLQELKLDNPRVPDFRNDGKSTSDEVTKGGDLVSSFETNLEEFKSVDNPAVTDLRTDDESTSNAVSKTGDFVPSFETNLEKPTPVSNAETPDVRTDSKTKSEAVSKLDDLVSDPAVPDVHTDDKATSEVVSKMGDFDLDTLKMTSVDNPVVPNLCTDEKSTLEIISKTGDVASSYKINLEDSKVTSEGNPEMCTDNKSRELYEGTNQNVSGNADSSLENIDLKIKSDVSKHTKLDKNLESAKTILCNEFSVGDKSISGYLSPITIFTTNIQTPRTSNLPQTIQCSPKQPIDTDEATHLKSKKNISVEEPKKLRKIKTKKPKLPESNAALISGENDKLKSFIKVLLDEVKPKKGVSEAKKEAPTDFEKVGTEMTAVGIASAVAAGAAITAVVSEKKIEEKKKPGSAKKLTAKPASAKSPSVPPKNLLTPKTSPRVGSASTPKTTTNRSSASPKPAATRTGATKLATSTSSTAQKSSLKAPKPPTPLTKASPAKPASKLTNGEAKSVAKSSLTAKKVVSELTSKITSKSTTATLPTPKTNQSKPPAKSLQTITKNTTATVTASAPRSAPSSAKSAPAPKRPAPLANKSTTRSTEKTTAVGAVRSSAPKTTTAPPRPRANSAVAAPKPRVPLTKTVAKVPLDTEKQIKDSANKITASRNVIHKTASATLKSSATSVRKVESKVNSIRTTVTKTTTSTTKAKKPTEIVKTAATKTKTTKIENPKENGLSTVVIEEITVVNNSALDNQHSKLIKDDIIIESQQPESELLKDNSPVDNKIIETHFVHTNAD